jgi:hypothetical protein
MHAQLAWPGHRTKTAHVFVNLPIRLSPLPSAPSQAIEKYGSIQVFGPAYALLVLFFEDSHVSGTHDDQRNGIRYQARDDSRNPSVARSDCEDY